MSIQSRLEKLQKKLSIHTKVPRTQYFGIFSVFKDRSFEESQIDQDGTINSMLVNGTINALQGKKYIGAFTYDQKPNVAEFLKKLYLETQEEIKDNPNIGCSLHFITLEDKENGELILKKQGG